MVDCKWCSVETDSVDLLHEVKGPDASWTLANCEQYIDELCICTSYCGVIFCKHDDPEYRDPSGAEREPAALEVADAMMEPVRIDD